MRAVCTLFLTTALSGLGCSASTPTDGGEAENVTTSTSSEALSVYQWSADSPASNNNSYWDASIATFNIGSSEVTMLVHTGADNNTDTRMFFSYTSDGIAWTLDKQIPNMYSSTTAHMAAFNGYLYMVHNGASDVNNVYMSRFNPGTMTWDHDFQLPYRSWGAPTMASFNGSLYIIGTTLSTGQVWQATMSTAEVFSPQADLPGIVAGSYSPSLTVHCPSGFCYPSATLYMAYRSSAGELTMSGLQIPRRGTPSWWTPWAVANVDGSHKLTSVAPALASYGGYLHVVDRNPSTDDLIKWTYYDGANWSTDVSIASQRMWNAASLSARSNRLVMVHSSSKANHNNNNDYRIYSEYFQ